jgi:hypothetical protein
MRKLAVLVLVLLLAGIQPASARGFSHSSHGGTSHGNGHWGGHHFHGGRAFFGIGIGLGFYDWWWWPGYYGPYYYGDYYSPVTPYQMAVPSYYYCANPAGYYPTVTLCTVPWMAVPIPAQQ